MSLLDQTFRHSGAARDTADTLPSDRRADLIRDVAARLLVPALLARFGTPPVGTWRSDAAALAGRLGELPLAEAVAALADLNPGGQMFRPVCRDIILPAALGLRRGRGPGDEAERLARVWRLRMCVQSLDDSGPGARPLRGGLFSALALTGARQAPSVEHGVALRFFDRAGWQVCDSGRDDADEACDSAHDRAFDVAWISLGPGMDRAGIRATARDIRRASCNAGILVLGGGMAGLHPEDPADLDLDGYTGSPIEAAVIAETALRSRRVRHSVQ